MRIAIDIDGTIASFKLPGETYADVIPLPGAVEKIKSFKKNGHYIILITARHMKTCNSNVGLVIAKQGKILLDWLDKYSIPYDEIWFGKPFADIYIDDNGYRFTTWSEIFDDASNLPINKEKLHRGEG